MRVPIFYYHSVGAAPPQTLALRQFRAHLEHIRAHGYQTLTLADLAAHGPRPRSVVLTFDDGLLDNYTRVFPLLLELGMVATFYVVPGYDHVTRWVNPWTGGWSDEPRELYTQPFESMKRHHRLEMHRHGMEIGCHTATHRKLTQVPSRELESEIAGAKSFLEDELGSPVTTLTYPNGRFNREVLEHVRRAGFKAAGTTIPGYWSPKLPQLLLPRFLTEDPTFFEAVLLGRAFQPAPLIELWRRKVAV